QAATPVRRAEALLSPQIGLIDAAVAELRAAPETDAAARLTLGDVLLRKGLVKDAREAYRAVRLVPAEQWQLDLRKALCLWVEGDSATADDALAALDRAGDQPLVKYYLAAVLEQIGRYREAQSILGGATADTGPAADLIRRLRIRLEAR
ncbi:MAG TPA: hypothetical protein DCX07_01930, partial [Phycisphaerales bacterium]|nr:hypothetical protein [Phycisphaerales bacterium]